MENSTLALALLLVCVVIAITVNRICIVLAEHRERMERLRPETRRRNWQLASPSGTVRIGYVDYATALERASKIGKVSFTDMEHAIIFCDTHLGGASSESMPQ